MLRTLYSYILSVSALVVSLPLSLSSTLVSVLRSRLPVQASVLSFLPLQCNSVLCLGLSSLIVSLSLFLSFPVLSYLILSVLRSHLPVQPSVLSLFDSNSLVRSGLSSLIVSLPLFLSCPFLSHLILSLFRIPISQFNLCSLLPSSVRCLHYLRCWCFCISLLYVPFYMLCCLVFVLYSTRFIFID